MKKEIKKEDLKKYCNNTFYQKNNMYNKFIRGNGHAIVAQPTCNNENKGRPTYLHILIRGMKNGKLIVEILYLQYTWGRVYAECQANHKKIKAFEGISII